MQLQVLGCGDAFGSGGRFHTCFHVSAGSTSFLIDCGASSLIAMRRFGVDPNTVRTVLISHLHGDHFGGLPFLLLDAQFVSRRTTPLTIAGPPTLSARLQALRETMFPGSTESDLGFPLDIVELEPQVTTQVNGVSVIPYLVRHPSGAPSYALRCQVEHQTLCYSGDTEWAPALIEAARGTDVFIAECYTFDGPVPFHMNWMSLREHLPEIGAKRVLLTHMSKGMLEQVAIDGAERTEDGLVLEI
ncbi:MBL fold metallo-hydrolase [Microvirga sp. VF16]|uniref:MBL fold metallo-hydrolase n=1 Tax=Microvirga sp. VF16 TaxID=2807101 RepID=UPI00193DE7AD|nr:MBL fold metallo-hydrolase [Microvirga sp. VF16]QRM29065.1 MBL fold metallo-hydrolase [Microvirga sp. VF16]